MKKYIIEEKQLLSLLEDSIRLGALDAGGVDNWSWYGENFREVIAEFFPNQSAEDLEDTGFENCAEELLKSYEEYIGKQSD